MPLFVQDHRAARDLLITTAAFAVVAESWATYAGNSSSGSPLASRLSNLVESIFRTLVPSNRGRTATVDRGTKRLLVLGTMAGGVVAYETATRFTATRWASNDWFGVILGAVIAISGIALRAWGVKTLGRYFQREVVIEPEQTIVQSGPYRWVRHPAYTGNLLVLFGFGVAVGSWVGAVLGTAVALLGQLPRIRVEEQALHDAFGQSFDRYAARTARVVPAVW